MKICTMKIERIRRKTASIYGSPILAQHDPEIEIVISDNASQQDYKSYIDSLHHSVTLAINRIFVYVPQGNHTIVW